MNNTTCDLASWVSAAPGDQREFREAVHVILTAITSDLDLQKTMIMKGGLLMAIRYHSHRFTKDLDFSSTQIRADFDVDDFQRKLSESLAATIADSEYNLDCRIQRCRINPNDEKASFPNIELSLGYAYKGTPKHQRLLKGQSPTKVDIDFNLNERILGIERLDVGGKTTLQAYVFTDLVAEKLRSLLQQEIRNRYRRQDTYDLRLLIESGVSPDEKIQVLESLRIKARSRQIEPEITSLENPEVRRRAKRDYPTLADEIEGELPDFDESYELILKFYRSLPWD